MYFRFFLQLVHEPRSKAKDWWFKFGGMTSRLLTLSVTRIRKLFGGSVTGSSPSASGRAAARGGFIMAMPMESDCTNVTTMGTMCTGTAQGKINKSNLNRNVTVPRHIKYRQKVGGTLPPPSFIELQVIGTGREGTPQSFCLSTQHNRYADITGHLIFIYMAINLGPFTCYVKQ